MVPPTHLLRHPLPPPQTAAPADRNGSGSLGHWKRKSGRSGCHCLRILASWASHLHHLNHLNNLHHLTHLSAPLSLSVHRPLQEFSERLKAGKMIIFHSLSSSFIMFLSFFEHRIILPLVFKEANKSHRQGLTTWSTASQESQVLISFQSSQLKSKEILPAALQVTNGQMSVPRTATAWECVREMTGCISSSCGLACIDMYSTSWPFRSIQTLQSLHLENTSWVQESDWRSTTFGTLSTCPWHSWEVRWAQIATWLMIWPSFRESKSTRHSHPRLQARMETKKTGFSKTLWKNEWNQQPATVLQCPKASWESPSFSAMSKSWLVQLLWLHLPGRCPSHWNPPGMVGCNKCSTAGVKLGSNMLSCWA